MSWYDPSVTAAAAPATSGLDFLRTLRDGGLPRPPMAALLGMGIREVEPGRVVFEYEPDESVYNPIGMVHGGVVCTLADTVIGCAVHTTLGPGVGYTSIDLQVGYLRPLTVATGVVVATGLVVKPGRRVAFARAEVADAGGRLLAEASGTCLIIDGGRAAGEVTPGPG
ncbi:MAG: PaaI family thioesterase [Acidimicrobiales bacterium]